MTKIKRLFFALVLVVLFLPITACGSPESTYKNAQDLLSQGKFTEAAEKFESLGSYEDATAMTMYCKACALCESGNYDIGLLALESLGEFKDCTYRITYYNARAMEDMAGTDGLEIMLEAKSVYMTIPLFLDSLERIVVLDERIEIAKIARYNAAIALMNEKKYKEAYDAFVSLDEHKDSAAQATVAYQKYKAQDLKKASVGFYITFGAYEQDANTSNGKEDIEWLVLAKENDRMLVISRYALDRKQYNEEYADVTWETCTLRKWLNNDFLKAAFSSVEQAMIPTVTVSADKNPDYSTKPGNATKDKAFLLSIPEANKYLTSASTRLCKPTAYAKKQGADTDSFGFCPLWLRSPGNFQHCAAVVHDGGVNKDGYFVNYVRCAVRPALWINLEP